VRRGRPVTKWLQLPDVAAALRVAESWLAGVLAAHPAALPGWDGDSIRERDLLRFLSGESDGPLPAMVTAREVAAYLGVHVSTVHEWRKLKRASGSPLLPSVTVLDRVRIPAAAVLSLPACWPSDVPRPLSFFSATEEVSSR
jgi:hypothetical protein